MSDRETENSQELWGGRFSEPTDAFVQRFTASEAFDRQLAVYDIAGSGPCRDADVHGRPHGR